MTSNRTRTYYNVVYSYGREFPRIVGNQHETLSSAKRQIAQERASATDHPQCAPVRAWIEGFRKTGEAVERIY